MKRRTKRIIDALVSTAMLVLAAPVLVLIAAAIWTTLGSPILFRQMRPGRNARPFLLLKFRTMSNRLNAQGDLLPDTERLTRLGRFLRSTSLDELPELWNVLKGDMSLVGPRPLLPEYLPFYSDQEARRHHVRPGITGLAQVSGRNALSWDEKLALDVWYVEHWSIFLDLKILAQTISAGLRREGISAAGHVTMPRLDEQRQARSR